MILIIVDEPRERDAAASVLVDAGWKVQTASSGNAALELLARVPPPMLILLDPDVEDVSAIRASDLPAAAAPVVAYTAAVPSNPERLYADGFDDILQPSASPEHLLSTAARWQPAYDTEPLDRLEASFGTEQIRSMVARLGELVAEALAALHQGKAQPIAHRVAGIAGILGFASVGKAWLAISEGDELAADDARYESRRALAAIACR